MADIEVIQLGDDTTSVVEIRQLEADSAIPIDIPPGPRRLDDLEDVSGADAADVGQALVKNVDAQWRPATVTGGGGGDPGALAYAHTQDSPSTVWVISHGLGFTPAGIEVIDHIGQRHFPLLSYPSTGVVRLDFDDSVRGTARLS